jgi:hypothetical protein
VTRFVTTGCHKAHSPNTSDIMYRRKCQDQIIRTWVPAATDARARACTCMRSPGLVGELATHPPTLSSYFPVSSTDRWPSAIDWQIEWDPMPQRHRNPERLSGKISESAKGNLRNSTLAPGWVCAGWVLQVSWKSFAPIRGLLAVFKARFLSNVSSKHPYKLPYYI